MQLMPGGRLNEDYLCLLFVVDVPSGDRSTIEQELAKAEKKVNAARSGIERLQKVVAKPETPEEIKAKSAEEIKVLEAEMAALSLNIEQFSRMR